MDDAEPVGAQPQPILRLEESVVNRIAAGEVIQRPANAVKELIENALDAGSTRIIVTIKDGGSKLISIQDDGCGIRRDDLPILCERFTTSKLTAFEDLSTLTTYGFRGEALASISHIAHLSVTTKTQRGTCGYKAAYADGKLIPLKAGQDAEPKPLAATNGTLFIIEDLFYNVPLRRKALRSSSEEYNRIFDIVSRYAIHNAGVALVCRKGHATATPDLSTPTDASVLDNIGAVYGESVRRELVSFDLTDESLGLAANGWISNANYSAKKSTFLLFINNRLVHCPPLQRAVENYYSTILPKGGHPFAYISLLIEQANVDVNMHPTKAQVSFLDEDEVIEAVAVKLHETLASANASRSFAVQTVLTGVSATLQAPTRTSKLAPQKLVRTDGKAQTLESMLGYDATQAGPSTLRSGQAIDLTGPHDDSDAEGPASQPRFIKSKIPPSECGLTSINSMRRDVSASKQGAVQEILRNHTFVGFVGTDYPQLILQHSTKMFLVSYLPVCDALFYQLGLRQFGKMPQSSLKPAPLLRDLILLALTRQPELPEGRSPDHIADKICDRFMSAREMLEEYFSLVISHTGHVTAIPILLPRYAPNLDKLPQFLLRAGIQVDWKDERRCFTSLLCELAAFFRPGPFVPPDAVAGTTAETTPQAHHLIQHVIFPAIKLYLEAPASLLDCVTELASMESLYRRFGRC